MLYYLFRKKIRIVYAIVIILLIKISTAYFSETVDVYILQKAKLYTSVSVERAIREEVIGKLSTDEILNVSNKSYGELAYVTINTDKLNEILASTLSVMNEQIMLYESNKNYNNVKLPVSYLALGGIFNDIGPMINIKITPIGSISADIVSDVKSYGINNSMVRLDLTIVSEYQVLIPLRSKVITIKNNIPIVIKTINGEVPKYYYNSGGGSVVTPAPSDDITMEDII